LGAIDGFSAAEWDLSMATIYKEFTTGSQPFKEKGMRVLRIPFYEMRPGETITFRGKQMVQELRR
jgi:hypothetical protein